MLFNVSLYRARLGCCLRPQNQCPTYSVFLPDDCQNAWDELDERIKENIEIIFVKNYADIQKHLFAADEFAQLS